MIRRSPLLDVRSWFLLLVALSIALLPGCGGSRPKQGANHPAIGQPLLALELEPLTGDGGPVTVSSLKGRITLMNFWATWCPPCKDEFPKMAAMAKKFSTDPRFQYLSVNTEGGTLENDRIEVQRFLIEQHADHPTWTDTNLITRKGLIEQLSWSQGIPLTLVMDSTGTIRGIWNGYVRGDEATMQALIQELLNEK